MLQWRFSGYQWPQLGASSCKSSEVKPFWSLIPLTNPNRRNPYSLKVDTEQVVTHCVPDSIWDIQVAMYTYSMKSILY